MSPSTLTNPPILTLVSSYPEKQINKAESLQLGYTN